MLPSTPPPCLLCRHYHQSWQPPMRKECAAYGFRSEIFPSQVVLRETGIHCQLFEAREPAPRDAGEVLGPRRPGHLA